MRPPEGPELWAAASDAALFVGAAMALLWVVSLVRRDASIVDPFWGTGFVAVGWIYRFHGPSPSWRQLLTLVLLTVWGARLSVHLLVRNLRQGEDRRYAAMRRRHGAAFARWSLYGVFGLQGVLLLLISTPHLALQAVPDRAGPAWTDAVGIVLWLVGFGFEAVADAQLARFKAKPDNRGRVFDSGLWRLTRHPNYFGECLLWWGFWFLSLAAPLGALTVAAPVLLTWLLLKVSGVALLEKDIAERRPAYGEYVRRTNAFFPGPKAE